MTDDRLRQIRDDRPMDAVTAVERTRARRVFWTYFRRER